MKVEAAMTLEQTQSRPEKDAKVLDLTKFRQKKETKDEFGRGREPLYSSHLNQNRPAAPSKAARGKDDDFGDRLQRIRTSLDKINKLMGELRKMSQSSGNDTSRS